MRDKYFTFLYIPGNNVEPRTLRVRRSLIYSLIAVFVVAGVVAAGTAFRYSGKIKETYKLTALEKENEQLKSRLDQFTGEIEVLKKNVAQNFDFQKKARILAQLDDLSDDVTEVGIGGSDYQYIQPVSRLDRSTREKVLSTHSDIEKLIRQAHLQREGYQEIVSSLEASTERQRATPSLRPVNVGFLSSRFGRRMDPITGRRTMHRGVDFSARKGTPVFAPADGVVTFSGRWKTYGKVVEISHGQGYVTRFAHLETQLVNKGQRVKRGDIIARVGATGKSTFSHLHYEVEVNGTRVDPLKFILSR